MDLNYPETKTCEVIETTFGVTVKDPYRWLENLENKEVKEWIKAQNKLMRSVLDALPGREELKKELFKLFTRKIIWLHSVKEDKYFFFKREGSQNHPILYMTERKFEPASGKIIIDPNKFSKDGTIAMDWAYPSQNGNYIAYGKSEKGSESSTLYILEVENNRVFADFIPDTKWSSVVWAKDSSGFYYTRNTEKEKFIPKVYYHKIGTAYESDSFVFGKGLKENEFPRVYASEDGNYLFLWVGDGWRRNDIYFKDLRREEGFIPIAVGLDAKFNAEIYGEYIYILTDWKAPRWRILRTRIGAPEIKTGREIIKEDKGVIQSFGIAGNKLVVSVKEDTYTRLFVYRLNGEKCYEIETPVKGTAAFLTKTPDDPEIYYNFASFFYPPVIYKFNVDTKEQDVIWQKEIDFDITQLKQELVFYKSKDGTKVPMYIIYRKGLKRDGENPTILTGYGGFAFGMSPYFIDYFLPWIKNHGVYAHAGIRGGNEYGEDWHKAGMKENKQNVFDDFIYAAEYLIEKRYTSDTKLAIMGGSNGGLLVGAAMTQRPELFRAVICEVPLLDMIRFHKFGVAHIWTSEYGNPDNPKEFKCLYAYSPYHHVDENEIYPAVLLTSGDSEGRVHPMHPMKMAARLQKIAKNPVLLYVEPRAGHGWGKPLYKQIKSSTDRLLFAMWQLDMI